MAADGPAVGRVTVWEADGQPWAGAGYGLEIARRLRRSGLEVQVVPLHRRLPDAGEMAAPMHVVSGGATPATTATGWVAESRRLLQGVLARATAGTASVVGICFGAQLLSVALAGPRAVRPARAGMEAGLRPVRHRKSGATSVVTQFHYHEIRPSAVDRMGGTITHSNDHTRVQGFTVGPRIAGYQFHPELDPDAAAATYRWNTEVLDSAGHPLGSATASIRRHRHRWDPACFEHLVAGRIVTHPRPEDAPVGTSSVVA
jgi:GMP synthase-like glutamine amidotransferase